MFNYIIHPDSHSKLIEITDSHYIFEDQSKLAIVKGIPVLFSKESIFDETDIIDSKSTTQNRAHLDKSNLKNYIRRQLLPSLNKDFNINERYGYISKLLPLKAKMLVIGVGEKSDYYKKMFPNCEVITSDVHNQFKPDYIFDGHFIPFTNNCFDLVLAAQVIEHTINPWEFCKELQRVTKVGGLLQIEAPQNFPYHAEPYDFFRFTFTGMRSLFPQCEVLKIEITEGNASMVAVVLSNYLVNISSKKIIRSSLLFVARLLFGWLKYLDKLQTKLNRRTASMPIGYAFTFKKDNLKRKTKELLKEFYLLKK
ncbi:Methyltransferase domain-containing protein [Flaviramulus basaltis]|uniref:Methyltransferase domain-containing protein n=1 Tax=Flaviramulus basaltis TaxID=369401 RepID=A0A1K2IKE5_9FLAO|nr:methyltransferase domain-containing protein [Flaviramulus basaltis]SFZ92925.1 Methyltransferase domain-containing protein [Flaviramulus basaltis]